MPKPALDIFPSLQIFLQNFTLSPANHNAIARAGKILTQILQDEINLVLRKPPLEL